MTSPYYCQFADPSINVKVMELSEAASPLESRSKQSQKKLKKFNLLILMITYQHQCDSESLVHTPIFHG